MFSITFCPNILKSSEDSDLLLIILIKLIIDWVANEGAKPY